jgi:predicted NBD/HSP70 family sugar kinase
MSSIETGGTRAAAILRAVHATPGISRARLVRQLGLSSGLAADTVARLREARLVWEIDAAATGGRGRPTRSLVAHPAGPVVGVVAISPEDWQLCAIELGGGTVASERHRHDRGWAPLRRVVRSRLRRLGGSLGGRMVAVCVSVPGTVSGESLIQAPMLGWNELELSGLLPSDGPWAFLAGNDASFAAVGEARRGSASGAGSIVHLHMDNGIGGALIDAGHLVTGAQGMAGEFGHMPFGQRSESCRCGSHGCWNTALDGRAFARRTGRAVTDEVSLINEVLAAAAAHPGPERRAAQEAALSLGDGAAALVNAHDPELVCLTGLAPTLRGVAPKAVAHGYERGLMSSRRAAAPPLVDGRLDDRAAVIGAAEHAFDQLLADANIEHWHQA